MKTPMTPDAQRRRLQDTLIIAGDGVIAFSVWAVAKTALFLAFTSSDWLRQLLDLEDAFPIEAVYIAVGFFLCLDLVVRAFVGLSARAEGRGKEKSPFYLFVAVFVAIANALSAISVVLGATVSLSPADSVISIVIEGTAIAALVLVIHCSVRLRSLRKASG